MLRLSRTLAGIYLLVAVVVLAYTLALGPLGWAPFQLATLGPGGAPVVVTIAYSTEKQAWLEDAVRRFLAANPHVGGRPIQIVLESRGSREIVNDIVENNYRPTVVSPASMAQIEQLRSAWAARQGGTIIGNGADAPQPLVITPLVLVTWADRASVLEQAAGSPDKFWETLHTALTAPGGWADLGGSSAWGQVKFAHTSPETSNSGLQTLLLLAYGYQRSSSLSVAQAQDPGFREWLLGVENALPAQLEQSTGALMTDMVRFGPSKYDFVAVYENLAIEAIDTAAKRGQELRIFYPPATILSDHPYAVLDAPWVSNAERAAARQFRDFLLAGEMQELALRDYSFRPANPQVAIDPSDTRSPFKRYTANGVKIDIGDQVTIPPGDVIDALVATWRQVEAQTIRP